MEITVEDVQIIEKMKQVVPKLSTSGKRKLLTVAETMMMLHELKSEASSTITMR